MASRFQAWLARRSRARAASDWSALSADAARLDWVERSVLRDQAVALRHSLNGFLLHTDRRAKATQAALASLQMPAGTDWRWRPAFMSGLLSPNGMAAPEAGQMLGDQVALWHDCCERAIILRQRPNLRATDLALYGLTLEVLGFTGSYLSLSVDLPCEALSGLSTSHILRLETGLLAEQPIRIYGRLNVSHGPNTEQILRELPMVQSEEQVTVISEFDLAFTEMNANRLNKIWLDLIFENPQMNRISIREMLLSRHLRAEI